MSIESVRSPVQRWLADAVSPFVNLLRTIRSIFDQIFHQTRPLMLQIPVGVVCPPPPVLPPVTLILPQPKVKEQPRVEETPPSAPPEEEEEAIAEFVPPSAPLEEVVEETPPVAPLTLTESVKRGFLAYACTAVLAVAHMIRLSLPPRPLVWPERVCPFPGFDFGNSGPGYICCQANVPLCACADDGVTPDCTSFFYEPTGPYEDCANHTWHAEELANSLKNYRRFGVSWSPPSSID